MELILGTLFGAGVTIAMFWLRIFGMRRELDFWRDSSDFWRKLGSDMLDERQTLRDRLAAALWELRRVKRAMAKTSAAPLSREDIAWGIKWAREHGYGRLDDDQVTWRLGELERKIATWEGD